jgi:hypothetical protein
MRISAAHRQLAASPQGVAVDSSDNRGFTAAHSLPKIELQPILLLILNHRGRLAPLFDISPGAKGPAGTGDDHNSHIGIGLYVREELLEIAP